MTDRIPATTTEGIYQDELEAALDAVQAASIVCATIQAGQIQSMTKDDRSPVTVADFASQAVVCARLADAFPDDPVVGEEDATSMRAGDQSIRKAVVDHVIKGLGQTADEQQVCTWIDRGGADPASMPGVKRYWTVDPIDGTKGFLRGGQYAVALGLIVDGRVVLGVLGCPNLPVVVGDDSAKGAMFSAVRGSGASVHPITGDGEPAEVRVDSIDDPARARFCESVESGHSNLSLADRIAKDLGITADPVRMDSQAKYATVARGDASIYLRLPTRPGYQEKIWDHAAGAIVIEEAGGTVTDVDGKPLDFSLGRTLAANRGVVATNGPLHDRVIASIQKLSTGATGSAS